MSNDNSSLLFALERMYKLTDASGIVRRSDQLNHDVVRESPLRSAGANGLGNCNKTNCKHGKRFPFIHCGGLRMLPGKHPVVVVVVVV